MNVVVPNPPQLPAPGSDAYNFWTDTQWQVLFSLLDAVIPSIAVADGADGPAGQLRVSQAEYNEAFEITKKTMKTTLTAQQYRDYLAARPIDNPRFIINIKRAIANLPTGVQVSFGGVLNFMATRLGSLVCTHSVTPIHQQTSGAARQAIVRSWQTAYLPIWPKLATAFCNLARVTFAHTDPMLHQISGYSTHIPGEYRPGPTVEYGFLQFETGEDEEEIAADVVIVGSGCGGGVCAKVLAEAGHRVLVVDKGYYFPPNQMPMPLEAAQKYLYEGGGAIQTTKGSMGILAGSCWGGGGTVNWSASLRTQDFVRREWAEDRGLDFFAEGGEFDKCLDRICEFMGVGTEQIRHNHPNRVLLEGAKQMGWEAKACPQNTGGKEHYCGHCMLGCGSGEKQGPAVSWLPAAAKAGAQFIEGFNVDKILFDDNKTDGSVKRASGVVGTWTSRGPGGAVDTPDNQRNRRVVRVKARRVIVSSGSLHSPLLLQRSGVDNPQIGKNLYLHPASTVVATFSDYDRAWEGGILTSVVSSFENLDGKGHGVKIEVSSQLPHLALFQMPWHSALQWKTDALKFRHMESFVQIARDRDTGRVVPDRNDPTRPAVVYEASAFDRSHNMVGMVALSRLLYLQGATEIHALVSGMPAFRASVHKPDGQARSLNDVDFATWLGRLERSDLTENLGSAHQMGTCRMSSRDDGSGVVDPKGKVWGGYEGLYVADASVFPSASGVNPMITNMAIADNIARGISDGLVS